MKYFDLKVGFTCNNNCVHCVIADKKDTHDLSTEEIKSIIDKIPTDTAVGFTGGEASIRKDFIELLEYAKKTGHITSLQTNATMFSNWDFAVDASKVLDNALVAIHSHIPSVHDSIVRTPGMYEKTIEGFKNLIKLHVNVDSQTVISKLNIENLLETYDFIQSIKPGIHMNLTFPHPNGNAYHNHDIVVPRYSEIKDVIQSILKKYGELLNVEAIPMCYLYPYQDIVYNIDEHIRTLDRPGIDPANKDAGYFDNNGFTENYRDPMLNDKRKAPKCLECDFNDRCVGVWKEYIEFYQNKFDCFPVKLQEKQPEIKYEECTKKEEPEVNQEWGALIVYGKQKCLNTCTFCSGSAGPQDDDKKLETAKRDIDFHINNGIRKFEISGGDPGEYSRIVEVIEYIKKSGATDIQLSTHGRTLKDMSLVKALFEAGVTQLKVPLYGSTAEIHNKTTQVSNPVGNAFEDTVQGIKNAVEVGIPICGYVLLNQYNKDDIANIIKLYQQLVPVDMLVYIIIGLTFIAQLDYSYTKDWFLPIKDMKPYLEKIIKNKDEIMDPKIPFWMLDVPYCAVGDYTNLIENPFEEYPNLGLHDVEKSNQSAQSKKVPHYRIKSQFDACKECCLKDRCGGIPVNEIKMFGTYGLEGIKE